MSRQLLRQRKTRQLACQLTLILIGDVRQQCGKNKMTTQTQADYDFNTSRIHRAMILEQDADKKTQAYFEINDPTELSALEHLFPSYREFVQSESNEWTTTKYRIYMCLFAGRTIKIISDGKRWGVTFGSFPINGDLEAVIAKMKPTLVRPEIKS